MMSGTADPAGNTAAAHDGTDLELLTHVAQGDQEAMATLYGRYERLTFGLALRITKDPTLAEDVVQDAMVGVWRNASRYASERGSVRTWMMSIVHHRAVDAIRRRRFTSELPEGDAPPPPSLVLPDIWPVVAQRLDRAAIEEALAQLSPPQREAVELAYFGGLTQQEIAARTASPLGTVKSRVRLGLIALGRVLVAETSTPQGLAVGRTLATAPQEDAAS